MNHDVAAVIAIVLFTIVLALAFSPPPRGGPIVVDKLPDDCWSEPVR